MSGVSTQDIVPRPDRERSTERLRGGEFLLLTTTRFFGRDEEIALLSAMLSTSRTRLVTLTGPGGTGKTRLALELAARLVEAFPMNDAPTSSVFVPLADVEEPGRLFEMIARALGEPLLPGEEPLDRLETALSVQTGKLLILDNFEHLVEEGAVRVRDLLARTTVKLLVTSRQKLGVEGENEFLLAPLPTPGGARTPEAMMESPAFGLFVDYINSPEAKYPTQNEHAYASLEYVVEHTRELNVDASRLAIVGDSVGGNMTAAVTLMAKERVGPKIDAQVLFYPLVDYISDSRSYRQFAEGPWLTAKTMKWMFDLQGLDGSNREITAFPLRATIEQLKGLPDAPIIIDDDILQDEGEAYARKLSQAGVRVTSVRYNGTIHDFAMLNPLAETPAARAAIAQTHAFLREAFSR